MRKLSERNALEQNSLNDLISGFKKDILDGRRRVHELESELSDARAQYKMK